VAGAPTAGGLPVWGSLLEIEPAGTVALGALKAAGNPLTAGSVAAVDPADGVAIRLVETIGSTTEVTVHSGLRSVSVSSRADLLEQPIADADGVSLRGSEIATVLGRFNLPRIAPARDDQHAALAPDEEAAQPLYARYWLHNRGPAPLGGLPAVAHLHPERVAASPGAELTLRLTAASDCTDAPLHGKVRLIVPDGWAVEPAELPFVLPAGDYLESEIALTVPVDAAVGVHPVRAELAVTGSDTHSIPASWRQVVEDVCTVWVGPQDSSGTEVLRLVSGPEPVDVAAGESARLTVTVGTNAHADLAVEAHLISPWGTWEWIGPAAVGAELPAAGTVELEFDVSPPVWTEPGEWWALMRIGCAGHLVYTPAVKVTVR
jgi:alpha-mannosidase